MEDKYRKRIIKKIGLRIATVRKKQGMSQEKLLECLYCDLDLLMDRNTLSLIERGRVATNWYNLFAICYVLGLAQDELFV